MLERIAFWSRLQKPAPVLCRMKVKLSRQTGSDGSIMDVEWIEL